MSLSYRSSSRPSWSSGFGASSSASINRSSSISGGGISSRIPSTVYGSSSLGFSGSSSGRLDYHGLGASSSSCSTSSLGNSVAKPADSYQRRGDSGWRSDISRTGLYPATSSASSFQTARAQGGYVSTGLTRSPRDFTRGSLGSSTVSGNGIDGRRRSSGSSDKMPLPTSPGSDAVFEYSGGARRRSRLGSDVSSDSLLKREETSRFNKRSEKSDECSPIERRASDSKPSSRSSTSSSSSSFRRGRETFRHEDEFSEIKTGVVFQAGPSSVDDSSAPTGSTTNRSTESSGYSSRPVKSEQSQEALKYRNSKSGKSETAVEKDNGRKECSTHPEASTPADKPKRVQRAGFRDRKLKSQLSTGSDCDNEPPASDLMSSVNCTQSEELNGGKQAKDITNPVDSVSGVFDKKLASYVKDCDTKSKLPSLESGQNLCTHDAEICPNVSDGNGASKCSPGFAIKSDKTIEDYVNSEVSSTHGAQGQSLQTRGQTNINRRDDTSVVINTSRTSSSGAKQSQRALGKPATDAGSHVPAGTRKFSTSSPEGKTSITKPGPMVQYILSNGFDGLILTLPTLVLLSPSPPPFVLL
ncbi:hypothetical protein PoB_003582400 [Plakobranchus ocellatus]|uniref:Uncharacterized protein n=1 Tax=Plakobranchus ocellatus TaxID=259542 RepID=A0AAV4ANE9_9GAST|nr:hypothetical protein PoB_003582400 [Plakobranchus ocellatus]